jgi:arginyl-tRNA synthetase
VLRRAAEAGLSVVVPGPVSLLPQEKEVIVLLHDFPGVVKEAGEEHSPAVIANYAYELAAAYNRFYHDLSILKEEDPERLRFRLALCNFTGNVIRQAMWLLGIEVPERM